MVGTLCLPEQADNAPRTRCPSFSLLLGPSRRVQFTLRPSAEIETAGRSPNFPPRLPTRLGGRHFLYMVEMELAFD